MRWVRAAMALAMISGAGNDRWYASALEVQFSLRRGEVPFGQPHPIQPPFLRRLHLVESFIEGIYCGGAVPVVAFHG